MDTIASHKRQKNAVSRHGGSQRGAEATKTAEKAVAGGSEDELTSGDAALALVSSPARSTSPVVGSGSPQTTPPGPVLTTSPLMASSPSFYPLAWSNAVLPLVWEVPYLCYILHKYHAELELQAASLEELELLLQENDGAYIVTALRRVTELLVSADASAASLTAKTWPRTLAKLVNSLEHLIYWKDSPLAGASLQTLPILDRIFILRLLLDQWLLTRSKSLPDSATPIASHHLQWSLLGTDTNLTNYWTFAQRVYSEDGAISLPNGTDISTDDLANTKETEPTGHNGKQRHKTKNAELSKLSLVFKRNSQPGFARTTRNSKSVASEAAAVHTTPDTEDAEPPAKPHSARRSQSPSPALANGHSHASSKSSSPRLASSEQEPSATPEHANGGSAEIAALEPAPLGPLDVFKRWHNLRPNIQLVAWDRDSLHTLLNTVDFSTSPGNDLKQHLTELLATISNENTSAQTSSEATESDKPASATDTTKSAANGNLGGLSSSSASTSRDEADDAATLDSVRTVKRESNVSDNEEANTEQNTESNTSSNQMDVDIPKPAESESAHTMETESISIIPQSKQEEAQEDKRIQVTVPAPSFGHPSARPIAHDELGAASALEMFFSVGSKAITSSAERLVSPLATSDAAAVLLSAVAPKNEVLYNESPMSLTSSSSSATMPSKHDLKRHHELGGLDVDAPRQKRQAAMKVRDVLHNGLNGGASFDDVPEDISTTTDKRRKRGEITPKPRSPEHDDLSIRIRVPTTRSGRGLMNSDAYASDASDEPPHKKRALPPPGADLLANLANEAVSALGSSGHPQAALGLAVPSLAAIGMGNGLPTPLAALNPQASAIAAANQAQLLGLYQNPMLANQLWLGANAAAAGAAGGLDPQTLALLSYNQLLASQSNPLAHINPAALASLPPQQQQQIILQQQLYQQQLFEAQVMQQQQFILQQRLLLAQQQQQQAQQAQQQQQARNASSEQGQAQQAHNGATELMGPPRSLATPSTAALPSSLVSSGLSFSVMSPVVPANPPASPFDIAIPH